MKAIWRGKVYHVEDDDGNNVHLHGGVVVPFSDADLVIDPTDGELEGLDYAD
jgi:hypothetical protein